MTTNIIVSIITSIFVIANAWLVMLYSIRRTRSVVSTPTKKQHKKQTTKRWKFILLTFSALIAASINIYLVFINPSENVNANILFISINVGFAFFIIILTLILWLIEFYFTSFDNFLGDYINKHTKQPSKV